MKLSANRKTSGFTLVEILVVIAIIATLMGISFAAMSAITRNAKNKATKALIESIDSGLKEFASYPGESLPDGDGTDNSTIIVYLKLTGDSDFNGTSDFSDGQRPLSSNLLIAQKEGEISSTGQILDHFGNPIRYQCASNKGVKNAIDGEMDIWSAGEDGVWGNDDDINNWSQ